jgi:hypothetical protein
MTELVPECHAGAPPAVGAFDEIHQDGRRGAAGARAFDRRREVERQGAGATQSANLATRSWEVLCVDGAVSGRPCTRHSANCGRHDSFARAVS